jgi:hypothetical protein
MMFVDDTRVEKGHDGKLTAEYKRTGLREEATELGEQRPIE